VAGMPNLYFKTYLMPFLFSYLLKFSLSLMAVYVFYQLVLRRLTFYQWNRFYLLGYSLLCFVIPFIHIDGWLQQPGVPESPIITVIPALGYPAAVLPAAALPVVTRVWGLYDWLGLALLAGTVLMAGRLALLFLSLQRLRRKSVLLSADGRMSLFETDAAITPFSFGRSVYFNATRHTEEELQQIMRHEYVHIRQRHTIDLLAGELLCLINWYNPIAWLMRYSIRQNLEFIADSKVLENGVDRKEYQYLLLKVVGISQYRIANHFNFSNLKKRIVMMNKMKSARLHLGRFLFVLPLLGVLLVAFRRPQYPDKKPGDDFITVAGIVLDIYTKKPLAGAAVAETSSGLVATTDARGYYMLRLPAPVQTGDARLKYNFVASVKGYENSQSGFSPAPDKGFPNGVVQIMALIPEKPRQPAKMFFVLSHFKAVEEKGEVRHEPSYADAMHGYDDFLHELDDIQLLGNMRNNNPEVEQFYSSEDKKKQIVFLKDGGIEKYGYPGGPSLADMEKKYGKLPTMFTTNKFEASYYDKQWQEISNKLEKTFVPKGHAFKTIVFPGDSRVLVQFTTGRVVIYDMDYDKERTAFESLFGKLEAAPPPSRSDDAPLSAPSASSPPAAFSLPAAPLPPTDTTPAPGFKIALRKNGSTDTIRLDGITGKPGKENPLILVDGVEKPELGAINPSDIESISILKDDPSTKIYGEKGKNGVILITTKYKPRPAIDTLKIKADTIRWSAATQTLILKGQANLANGDVRMTASDIHFGGLDVRLAVDGRLLKADQDYLLIGAHDKTQLLTGLKKDLAQKKYGVNSIDGVLELSTL